MKLVTAIIKPFVLDQVRESLSNIGIQGITVTEVKGYGRQKGHTELYRGAEYQVDLLPKVKIEIAVSDQLYDQVIEAIIDSADTGNIGCFWHINHRSLPDASAPAACIQQPGLHPGSVSRDRDGNGADPVTSAVR